MLKQSLSLSLLALVLNVSCGKDKDDVNAPQQIASDPELSEASMNAGMQDAMNAMGDANANQETAALALDTTIDAKHECKAEGANAVVTSTAKFASDGTFEGPFNSYAYDLDVNFELTRTWSKSGASVECGPAGKFAKIDLSADPAGLKADVKFSRSVSASQSVTNKKTAKESKTAQQYKAEGSRSIAFSDAGSDPLLRDVTVSSDVTHTVTLTKKNGTDVTLTLKMGTDASAPLLIESKRAAANSNEVSERTLKSGKIVASASGQGRVEAQFVNWKVAFTTNLCEVASGKVTMSAFAEGSSTAALIYEVTAEDGSFKVMNVTDPAKPVEVEDFSIQACDLRNFQS